MSAKADANSPNDDENAAGDAVSTSPKVNICLTLKIIDFIHNQLIYY